MKITWLEIKEAVFRLMYLSDTETAEYEAYLPDAANYALSEIAMSVLPIVASYEVDQTKLTNLIPKSKRSFLYEGDSVSVVCPGGAAYSFECDGTVTVTIRYFDGTEDIVAMSADRTYQQYRGFFSKDGTVTFTFSGDHAYRIRNLACYKTVFGTDLSDIPSASKYRTYDMLALTEDKTEGRIFASFLEDLPVVCVSDESSDGYTIPDYYTERGSIVHINSEAEGTMRICYKRYPKKITSTTADDYELPIEPQASALIPLLMAWRILKDDDERKAVLYFNEYQSAKAQIKRPLTMDGSADVWA